jgi:hypothetical protein
MVKIRCGPSGGQTVLRVMTRSRGDQGTLGSEGNYLYLEGQAVVPR